MMVCKDVALKSWLLEIWRNGRQHGKEEINRKKHLVSWVNMNRKNEGYAKGQRQERDRISFSRQPTVLRSEWFFTSPAGKDGERTSRKPNVPKTQRVLFRQWPGGL